MTTTIGKFFIFLSILSGLLHIIPSTISNTQVVLLLRYLPSSPFKISLRCSKLGFLLELIKAILLSRSRWYFYLQTVCIISATLSLLYAFITNDFSVENVLFYSSTTQPLIYKIAALWGNHDASLLFLITLLALVSYISSLYIKEDISIKIMSIIITVMMMIVYYTSNPFVNIPNAPHEGLGMNPVLQDMAIAIHPPMLYLGYVTYIIPYACFLAILLSGKQHDLALAYQASKVALGFLTSGIALGSWWAYRELGWGGYWFFDPVENISLIPWLIGIALHHSFMVTMRNGTLLPFTIGLGITNFLLILFGILLVRSGMLVSVHSFASGIVGWKYIIGAFATLVVVSITIYLRSLKNIASKSYSFIEVSITSGNAVILGATICLMIGTFFPLIYQLINGINISLSNEYFYYIFIPLMLIAVAMAVIIPHLKSGFKFALNIKNTAMIFSHTGIVILSVGIGLNTLLKQDIEFIGKVGSVVQYENISISLKNIKYSEGLNYYRQIGEFWIEHNNETVILRPENRLYKIENAISAESDIYSFVTEDIYVVLGSLEDDGTLHANIYIRPWMSLIWLGMFLTAVGVFLSKAKISHKFC